MLLKALLVIAAIFALGLGARFLGAFRSAPWMAPALVGAVTFLIFSRFGIFGMAPAIGAAGVTWWLMQGKRAPPITDEAAARALLGVREGATIDEIRAAHRAAIRHAHPDKGGGTDKAAALNAARDLLLKKARASASTR
jgi:hypothetical protein